MHVHMSQGMMVAAFVVTAAVLLGLGLYSTWSLRWKLFGIAGVTAAYLLVYFSLPRMLGWPTDQQVPRRFNLLGVYIQEPDRTTGTAGDVFFWATDLAPGADPRPRAYHMPFKASFKSVFQEAQGKLRQNIPQEGEFELDDELQGVPLDWSHLGQKSVKLKIKDAPVNAPPSKGPPG
jgi:hypothetical protein